MLTFPPALTLTTDNGLALDALRNEVASEILARSRRAHPETWASYGEREQRLAREDVHYHLAYLAEAVTVEEPGLFVAYVQWLQVLFEGLGFGPDAARGILRTTAAVLAERLPDGTRERPLEYISTALADLGREQSGSRSALDPEQPLGAVALEYMECLLRFDREAACSLVLDSVGSGTRPQDIHCFVIQPVMSEVGRLWQTGKLSVAQEHYCTGVTQMVMARLYSHFIPSDRRGARLVMACAPGELHELGARMVADSFEFAGWETHYLGANTPEQGLVEALVQFRADVLALSVTIALHVRGLAAVIDAVRTAPRTSSVLVLVGGRPFRDSPGLWRKVGADACDGDAISAVASAEALLEERSR